MVTCSCAVISNEHLSYLCQSQYGVVVTVLGTSAKWSYVEPMYYSTTTWPAALRQMGNEYEPKYLRRLEHSNSGKKSFDSILATEWIFSIQFGTDIQIVS